ncbi:MAG TPA: hypothetical protein VIU10_09765, partial [Candidatus Udaeobacter sp.]
GSSRLRQGGQTIVESTSTLNVKGKHRRLNAERATSKADAAFDLGVENAYYGVPLSALAARKDRRFN